MYLGAYVCMVQGRQSVLKTGDVVGPGLKTGVSCVLAWKLECHVSWLENWGVICPGLKTGGVVGLKIQQTEAHLTGLGVSSI